MSYPWGQPQNPGPYPGQPGQFPGQPPTYSGQPWQYPGQSGPLPAQPGPTPYGTVAYGTPPGGYGPPPPPGGNRALWITLSIVGVVVVLLVGVFVFVVPKSNNSAGGQGHPRTGGQPSSNAQPPPIPAPPTDPLPARTTLYGNYPAACSLLSDTTVQTLYPKATGKDDKSDDQLDGSQDINHTCNWDAETEYVRFMSLDLQGEVGDGALDTVTSTYHDTDRNLTDSTPIDKVEAQRPVPNLGDEANLIYGTQDDGCRLARLTVRSQNAVVDVSYGGCDPTGDLSGKTNPISDSDALNGVMTMARAALQHLASANP